MSGHQHENYQIEHDITSNCCTCCRNTPVSIDLAQLDKYYEKAQTNGFYGGLLTPEIYEATKREIREFYDNQFNKSPPGSIQVIYMGPALFSKLFQIDLMSGSVTLRYSN